MSERKLFKDYFDLVAIDAIAKQFSSARGHGRFAKKRFVELASKDLETLEMMDRVRQISDALAAVLPKERDKALAWLEASLPEVLPDAESPTDGYLQWPLGQFIADHGTEHFEESMSAMIELTQRLTSEFAVRPFVMHQPEKTFARLASLVDHPSEHVRRWCSEGIRPRLPWGARLDALVDDPSPIWPILEALKDDPSLYVRRSVANCINDIAKDHPSEVCKRMKAWSKGASEERMWLVKHALRTLVKDGDPKALAILGYGIPKGLSVDFGVSPKKVALGDSVTLTAEIRNGGKKPAKLMVDLCVHYVRKRGTGKKVFKWKSTTLAAGKEVLLEKELAMVERSIRKLYPGTHRCEVQVNGQVLGEVGFELKR